eukprot:scaffold32855_cov66-Phaeocystis_antarctica.AAC.2
MAATPLLMYTTASVSDVLRGAARACAVDATVPGAHPKAKAVEAGAARLLLLEFVRLGGVGAPLTILHRRQALRGDGLRSERRPLALQPLTPYFTIPYRLIVIPVENNPQKPQNRLSEYHPLWGGGWAVNSRRHDSPHIRKSSLLVDHDSGERKGEDVSHPHSQGLAILVSTPHSPAYASDYLTMYGVLESNSKLRAASGPPLELQLPTGVFT